MTKALANRSVILTFFLAFFIGAGEGITLFAQNWTMPVDGRVFAKDEKLGGAVVTLYRNGQQIQQGVTTSNGKFSFELPPNGEFLISVTKAGYITKKIKILTTNVPPQRAEVGGFNPFEPDISLFEMPSAPEISKRVEAILSQPIAVYQFIPKEDNFNYDENYTNAIRSKLAELAQLQKEAEKETKEKAKQAALMAQQQLELDKQYKAAIAKADAAFGSKKYEDAKTAYKSALDLKPGEAYPKGKIDEINKILANAEKQQAVEQQYQAAITKADEAFKAKDYNGAKTSYLEASKIKPAETYPKNKIAEIDRILAEQKKEQEVDAKYKAAIAKADQAFSAKDYATAKTNYQAASAVKPAEKYPQDKISEIDKLLAAANKQKEVEENYKAAIAKADAAFTAKDYTGARTSYVSAGEIKPAETYPKTKIAEIDKLLAAAQKQEEVEAKYKAAIAKADQAFNSKSYATAKSSYTEASGIKPAEAYPKTRLAEIDKLMASAEADKAYNDAVAKADGLFAKKDYAGAKSAYTDASGIKPAEAYPKTKIAEIDKILADMAKAGALDKQYKDMIASADGKMSAQQYEAAKEDYKKASSLKPAEAYPKQKISEIDKLLAELAAKKSAAEIEHQYKNLLAKADGEFGAKNYENAKQLYSQASAIKPAETYPKEKIIEIDKLLASLAAQKSAAEKEKQYKDLIAKADAAFDAKDYAQSKGLYSQALNTKPTDPHPKNRIAEIDRLLAAASAQKSAAEKEQQYKDLITKADAAFDGKSYGQAKGLYTQALGVKPTDPHPKNRIAEIDRLLAAADAQKETEAKYKELIASADAAFNGKSYEEAKSAYSEASGVKPGEQYPKSRLAEIDRLLKAQAAAQQAKDKDSEYRDIIARADNFFDNRRYPNAKAEYQKALTLKPNESHPKNRLDEIDDILKKAKEAADKAQASVNKKKTEPPKTKEEQVQQYRNELRDKYPKGVTQEEYTDQGKTVLRRIVINDDFAGVYTKVTHNWGGIYFFKDNLPITEVMFENETR